MTNSADPDQLASSEANWSGSTLFAKAGHVVFSKRRVKSYHVCPKYWDTISTYFTSPKTWNSPFYYLFIAVCMANSVDPDQTQHSALSDLGLHCLQRPICPSLYCCMAKSVDPDQTPHYAVFDLVYTVCKGLSVQILRVIMESHNALLYDVCVVFSS